MSAVVDPASRSPGLLEELRRRARRRDVALLLAAPAVALLVFSLDPSTREALVFRAADPAVVTAFTAHYVHLSASHLAGNLVVYAGAVGLGYPLALLGGRRRLYLSLVAAVLLAYPFVLSGLHLVLVGRGGLLGLSGVAIALVGLLPLVLFAYLRSRVDPAVRLDDAPALFFLGTAAVAWQVADVAPVARPLVFAAAAIGVGYLVPPAMRLVRRPRSTPSPTLVRGYVELPVAAVLLFFLVLWLAVPATSRWPGAVAAHGTLHLLGFALGFVGAYLTARAMRALGPPAPPG